MESTVLQALNEGLGKIKDSQLIALVNNTATHCVSCLVPASAAEIEGFEESSSIMMTLVL